MAAKDKWYFTNALTKISALEGASGSRRALGRAIQLKLVSDPRVEGFQDLAGDLFSGLYYDARPTDGMPDIRRAANHAILRWLDKDVSGWVEAKGSTRGSTRIASHVAGAVWSEVMKNPFYSDLLKKQEEAVQAINKHGEGSPEAQSAAESLIKAIGDLDQFLGPVAAAQIAAQAAEDASDLGGMEAMAKSWGDEPGNASDAEIEKYLTFMRQNRGWIEALNEAIGRAYGIASTVGNKFDVEWGDVADVQPTKDLTQVFPDQYVGLSPAAPPAVRAHFVARYLQDGLLGLHEKMSGTQRGSIVLLVDYSGSMNAELTMDGRQYPSYVVAGGTAIGIIMAAREAGRNFYALTFSGSWQSELHEISKESSWTDVLDWVMDFQGGGTPLDAALNKAFDWLDRNGEDDMTLDVAVITDGDANVEGGTKERWEELTERFGTRLLDIGVDSGGALKDIRDTFVLVPRDDAGQSLADVARIIGEWIGG